MMGGKILKTVLLCILAFVLWLIGFLVYDEKFGSGLERRIKRAAQEKANQTPHVIREADGCKVYAFLAGVRYHYFTRCDNSKTTTEASREVCKTIYEGKNNRRVCHTEFESIESISSENKGN